MRATARGAATVRWQEEIGEPTWVITAGGVLWRAYITRAEPAGALEPVVDSRRHRGHVARECMVRVR